MTVELNDKILKQVEFYFGDANLPRDKFLRSLIEQDSEGWVSLEAIASFTRMKTLTQDIEIIKAALSKPSEIFQLSEDKTKLKRPSGVPESKDVIPRCVYVKGFPTSYSLDQLQEFFTEHSKEVAAIRMRYYRIIGENVTTADSDEGASKSSSASNNFKGSVFVEFKTLEAAQAFLPLDLTCEGKELTIKSKMDYLKEKNDEFAEKKKRRSQKASADFENPVTRSTPENFIKVLNVTEEMNVNFNEVKSALAISFPVAFVDKEYEPGTLWMRFGEPSATAFVATFSAEKPLVVGDLTFASFAIPSVEEYQRYCEACQTSIPNKRRENGRGSNRRFKPTRKRSARNDEHDDNQEEGAKIVKTGDDSGSEQEESGDNDE